MVNQTKRLTLSLNPNKTEIKKKKKQLLHAAAHASKNVTPQQTILVCGSVLSFCESTDVKMINDIRENRVDFFFSPCLPLSEQTKDCSRWVIFSSRGVTGVRIGSSMTKRLILTESLRLGEEGFANVSLPGSCNFERRNTLQLCAWAHGPPVTPTRHMCLQHSAEAQPTRPGISGIDTRLL